MHYRFGYCGINTRTPANLSEIEAHELRRMVEGKKSENISVAEKLVEYGYAHKRANGYIPNVVVISQSTNQKFLKFCERKNFSAEFIEHTDARGKLHNNILNTIEKINCTVREILYADLPEYVRTNTKIVNALNSLASDNAKNTAS